MVPKRVPNAACSADGSALSLITMNPCWWNASKFCSHSLASIVTRLTPRTVAPSVLPAIGSTCIASGGGQLAVCLPLFACCKACAAPS